MPGTDSCNGNLHRIRGRMTMSIGFVTLNEWLVLPFSEFCAPRRNAIGAQSEDPDEYGLNGPKA